MTPCWLAGQVSRSSIGTIKSSKIPLSAFHLVNVPKRESSSSTKSSLVQDAVARRGGWTIPVAYRSLDMHHISKAEKSVTGSNIHPGYLRDAVGRNQKAVIRHFASSAKALNPLASEGAAPPIPPPTRRPRSRRLRRLYYLLAFLLFSTVCYETIPPARHLLIASIRCLRLLKAVTLSVLDYKYTFLDWYPAAEYTPEERKRLKRVDRHACHKRSSGRLFEALKSNAGIYVKLGDNPSLFEGSTRLCTSGSPAF